MSRFFILDDDIPPACVRCSRTKRLPVCTRLSKNRSWCLDTSLLACCTRGASRKLMQARRSILSSSRMQDSSGIGRLQRAREFGVGANEGVKKPPRAGAAIGASGHLMSAVPLLLNDGQVSVQTGTAPGCVASFHRRSVAPAFPRANRRTPQRHVRRVPRRVSTRSHRGHRLGRTAR